MPKKILIVTYALPEELDVDALKEVQRDQENFLVSKMNWFQKWMRRHSQMKDIEVVFVKTGVGKLNSYTTLRKVLKITRDMAPADAEITVLNLGTAASANEDIGIIVNPKRFLDRSLVHLKDSGYLIEDDYVVPEEFLDLEDCTEPVPEPDYEEFLPETGERRYSCNSGDTFATTVEDAYQLRDGWTAVCDMEAFAQAKLCSTYPGKIKFICWKYITDKIGENSLSVWEETLQEANVELTRIGMDYIREIYNS